MKSVYDDVSYRMPGIGALLRGVYIGVYEIDSMIELGMEKYMEQEKTILLSDIDKTIAALDEIESIIKEE